MSNQNQAQQKAGNLNQTQILNVEQHVALRKVVTHNFPHIQTEQLVPVNMHEFSAAGTCFPLFFIKNKSNGRLFPIALMGLVKGQNLYYSDDEWLASYAPLSMRTWPFFLTVKNKNSDKMQWQVAANMQSAYLSPTEGELLFASGQPTPLLTRITNELTTDLQQKSVTAKFIEFLTQQNLIKNIKFELGFADNEKQSIDGIYVIDEDVLHNLKPEQVQDVYQKGYFQPIYSMLGSQHNLYELIKRSQAKKGIKAITSLNIVNT
jgi:hypothetical protein